MDPGLSAVGMQAGVGPGAGRWLRAAPHLGLHGCQLRLPPLFQHACMKPCTMKCKSYQTQLTAWVGSLPPSFPLPAAGTVPLLLPAAATTGGAGLGIDPCTQIPRGIDRSEKLDAENGVEPSDPPAYTHGIGPCPACCALPCVSSETCHGQLYAPACSQLRCASLWSKAGGESAAVEVRSGPFRKGTVLTTSQILQVVGGPADYLAAAATTCRLLQSSPDQAC